MRESHRHVQLLGTFMVFLLVALPKLEFLLPYRSLSHCCDSLCSKSSIAPNEFSLFQRNKIC